MPERLQDPMHWRKPRCVFVNSVSDLFHEDVPDAFIMEAFFTMMAAPQHVYQIFTKRPARMRDFIQNHADVCTPIWYHLPHIWLGTSVEHQAAADERIPLLLETPAAVRFLSMEPLLERVDIEQYLGLDAIEPDAPWDPYTYERIEPSGLHWVIVGGESGPHARPFRWEWTPVEQCRAAGVALFMKQMGSVWAKKHGATDSHGGVMADWPAHLQIREFPQQEATHGL